MSTTCPNKDLCGSCGWSHIPYDKQLEQKLGDINGAFALKQLTERCEEILASPKLDHYRNRMDYVIDFEGKVGMREKGKWWRVIDNHCCFIGDEKIDQMFYIARDWVKSSTLSRFDRKSYVGFLRYVVGRTSVAGERMLIIVTSAPRDGAEEALALAEMQRLNEMVKPETFVWSINHTTSDVSSGDETRTISGSGKLTEIINGIKYLVSPHAFFQTNSHGAGVLLDTVSGFCGDVKNKQILDLYCGSGFFGIALAKAGAQVTGVELVPEAIADARINVELNGVNSHAEFHDAKTEDFKWSALNPDLIILDPPRAGMHDRALTEVINNAPPEIVYISCNFKSFARELVLLKAKYDVVKMRAIDMFPHTPHVELVTLLRRR
jgi:23S rRNA (uracil-5-)-methyltransferase RumA